MGKDFSPQRFKDTSQDTAVRKLLFAPRPITFEKHDDNIDEFKTVEALLKGDEDMTSHQIMRMFDRRMKEAEKKNTQE